MTHGLPNPLSRVPRELAERLISKWTVQAGYPLAGHMMWNALRDKVEAVIREAMQRAQPQWISVEDKLPKTHEAVIVYMPKYSHIDTDCVQVSSLCGHK